MTLRQLELFIAVAETGSFSRGAEMISLTQSTVSQHIAALDAVTFSDHPANQHTLGHIKAQLGHRNHFCH